MEVILLQDIPNLGYKGEKKTVKDGFARNYLIPNNLAIPYTPSNLNRIKSEFLLKKSFEIKKEEDAINVQKTLSTLTLTIKTKIGKDGKLFGAITTKDIANALKKKNIDIDKKQILLDEPIKSKGIYDINIKLYKDINATVKLWVLSEEE